jgi:small-conductance mechanosensitive channel
MKKFRVISLLIVLFPAYFTLAQNAGNTMQTDSLTAGPGRDYTIIISEYEQQRIIDSIQKELLFSQLKELKSTDKVQVEQLQQRLKNIEDKEKQLLEDKKLEIEFLKKTTPGYPVTGILGDTIITIYTRRGELDARERAESLTKKIREIYKDDYFKTDFFSVKTNEDQGNILYRDEVVLSLSKTDALWYESDLDSIGHVLKDKITGSILLAKQENSLSKILIRSGLVLLVIVVSLLFFRLIKTGNKKLIQTLEKNKGRWLKKLAYKDYTFLNEEQEFQGILFMAKAIRWFIYIVLFYISISIIFSIFPFTRGWADQLFQLILNPVKGILLSIWDYLPNLFSIIAIYLVMKYFIRFVKYIFSEIESEKLRISGFHADWAMPTFSIVRFLLYAFMFVLIFPFLPGSDSNIFKGVSVFIGVLFSLGSTSAISNLVAGLVITYMRPFKVGDRIKIGDITGDIIEKSLLVTRVKTPKNEEVTIPNSSVLSGNTTNYSTLARSEGLIIHTTVTIGYDVPWKKMYEALLNAADKTDLILKEPKPFVLQTSLDDFYVAYQINGYTRETNRHNLIYSVLHQNIQDCCNEMGIEIMSPHYRTQRDGNMTTIPADYLPKDYKVPGFNVNIEKNL